MPSKLNYEKVGRDEPQPFELSLSDLSSGSEKYNDDVVVIEEQGASFASVFVNTLISFVGAGILGLPFAFSKAGLFLATVTTVIVGALSVYCMLCLIWCKTVLLKLGVESVNGYGEVGRAVLGGNFGQLFVDTCLILTQTCFIIAYLIFIAANVNTMYDISRGAIIVCCLPVLCFFSSFRHLKFLAPVSLVAQVVNITGILIVCYVCLTEIYGATTASTTQDVSKISLMGLTYWDFSELPYILGVTVYCYEGMGLVLPLQASMDRQVRSKFDKLLYMVTLLVCFIYVSFSGLGYKAFGSEVLSPITLNMGESVPALVVKTCFCISLYLTYPLMLFPVTEILEKAIFRESKQIGEESTAPRTRTNAESIDAPTTQGSQGDKFFYLKILFRWSYVCMTGLVAFAVPDFGFFIAFVGSSVCMIIAFILPPYFHLVLFGEGNKYVKGVNTISRANICFDYFLIGFGLCFGTYGSIQSGSQLIEVLLGV